MEGAPDSVGPPFPAATFNLAAALYGGAAFLSLVLAGGVVLFALCHR